ncbi:uncharacterized protein LOC141641647 [Silene latifolia]|uniref:uncharacterized protein LOC141641647 n=1 Tax=Silene latifolia TaxID=37657 RepID=UPI003D76B791
MRKPEFSGRMAKWSVHLSGYDLKFEPRTAIKSQALADFVSDFCPALQTQAEQDILRVGVGLVLKSPQGDLIVQAVRCEFKATNNEAEYEALILGLKLALDLKIRHLQVCSDSKFIVNHVNDCYEFRDPRMMAYLDVAKELKTRFVTFNIKQIPRDQNAEADALATLGVTFKAGTISKIPIVHVLEPATLKSQQEAEMVCSTSSEENTLDWRKPYLDWLQNDILPAGKKEVRSFRMRASRFILIDGVMFRKSLVGPYLKCLDREESQAILHALHSGECGSHAGGRSLFGIPSEIICDNGS